MSGWHIYEACKLSQIDAEERQRKLTRRPSERPTSSARLRHQVARRGGLVLLTWAQALLRYGEPSGYRAETRPRSS